MLSITTLAADTTSTATPAEDLIRRARDGDALAFSKLVEDNYDLIYRTAYRWCGHQADAEDIAQDVCVKLGSAIRGFDGRSALSTWLYRVTLNAVRDMQRSRSRQQRREEAMAREETINATGLQEDAPADRIWDAVRQLPDKQKDAVLFVYAEGLTHAKAATILGCSEGTVSWHIHEAKKTLRGLL